MAQSYPTITLATDTVKFGITSLVTGRTDSLRSSFSGGTAPTGGVVGQFWFNTTTLSLSQLDSIGPDVWTKVLKGTLAIADGGTGATTAAGARTALGLGTAAVLDTGTSGANVPTITIADARYAKLSNNLSDLASASTARTNLGLGGLAILSSVGAGQVDNGAISTTAKLVDGIVTYAKLQVASTSSKLIGSPSTGTTLQEITIGTGLSLSGGTLTATGGSGGITSVARVTADVSAGPSAYVTVTDFTLAVAAGEIWTAEFHIYYESGGNGTAHFLFTTPTSPTSFLSTGFSVVGAAINSDVGISPTGVDITTNTTVNGIVKLSVTIENGSNAGSLVLTFKSGLNTSKVRKNSYMVARKH